MKLVEAMARMDVAFGNGQMELHQYIDSNGMRVSLVAKRDDPKNPSKVFKRPNQRLHYIYHHRHDMLTKVAWAYGENSAVNAITLLLKYNPQAGVDCSYSAHYHTLAAKALGSDCVDASYLWDIDGHTMHLFIATEKYMRKCDTNALHYNETIARHTPDEVTADYIHVSGSNMYEALVKLKVCVMESMYV